MDFDIPQELADYLKVLDAFIEAEIAPLQAQDDNERYFDHRREDARTDWDRGGLPNLEWEALLREARSRADKAGHLRYPLPKEFGGQDGTNLGMAIIREHLARKGLGLFNDLQNEHSIVGNNVGLLLMITYGTDEQKADWIDDLAEGRRGFAFGITEPQHGSDATHMETTAVRDGDEWIINGEKTWNTGIHKAQYDMIMARTSGEAGDGDGITAFLTPVHSPGFEIVEYLWTFNMPTDHAHIRLTDVRVPHSSIFGGEGKGLQVVQLFFNENRIRQAASSLGAAQFCIDQSIEYAKERRPFGKALASNQAIQFPLVELQTQCEMLRALVHKTAWMMDKYGAFSVSDKVSMCNYWANRLCCEAADRAMQVHGGLGYSRHKPFEHIYRHHRRYRITEGAEEIQMRRVAGYMFGFMRQQAPKGVTEGNAPSGGRCTAI
jgi:acyl-CoA dehydrogenase